MLSPRLLQVLRRYWCAPPVPLTTYSPPGAKTSMSTTSLQLACREAAARAGIAKRVTVHTLRQASA